MNYLYSIPPIYILQSLISLIAFILKNKLAVKYLIRIKGLKRFIGSFYLGILIAGNTQLPSKKKIEFANIFSYWILANIALDYVIDNISLNITLLESLFQKIDSILTLKAEMGYGMAINNSAALFALKMFSAFSQKIIDSGFTKVKAATYQIYRNATKDILKGQYESISQKTQIRTTNLNWYIKTVVKNKTYPFIIVPVTLLSEKFTNQHYETFVNQLYNIDKKSNYWQIQDDIGDLLKDLNDGILTTPFYLLYELCKIAEKVNPGISNDELFEVVVKNEVIRTIVNIDFLQYSHSDIVSAIFPHIDSKEILNSKHRLEYYITLKDKIKKITKKANISALADLIIESGVLHILVGNEQLLEKELVVEKNNAIKFIGRLMLNSIIKATKFIKNEENIRTQL